MKKSENELLRFYKNNQSGVCNIVVYLFWILMSILFQDQSEEIRYCTFPDEFMDKVRKAL